MECGIKIDRFREGQTVTANLYPYALPTIVYVHAHQQNYWLSTTRKTNSSTPLARDAQTQRGFIDERTSPDIPTIADLRIADDEQNEDMSEPTQVTTAEKRKVDEAAKELRALLPITASSHSSS